MAEYSGEQKNQLSRAIANNGSGSKQLISFVDNRQNILQCIQMAGAYKDTRKSDAHHMPSARAIAAIIMAGIALKTSTDIPTDAGEYHTLTDGDIYKKAPAVWMRHDLHARTRTYGGYSTGSLGDDMDIITDGNRDSDAKFDSIQQTDIGDYNGIVDGASVEKEDLSAGAFANASTETKSNIKTAIDNGTDVCTGGRQETFTTAGIADKVIMVDNYLIDMITKLNSLGNNIPLTNHTKANAVRMAESTYSELLRDCRNGYERGVSRDNAYRILNYFDKDVRS